MIRTAESTADAGYRGMKRSTRMSIIAGVAVFLTLVSGVSFAAWTASSTKTANATTGTTSFTTGATKTATTSTIAALGPVTYESTNQSVVKPITVWNTGSVAATVNSVTISRPSGSLNTLSALDVAVKIWPLQSATCGTAPTNTPTTPVTSTSLTADTITLATPQPTIAAGSSTILCASTTFTGTLSNQVRSISTELLFNASASANWKASDTLTASSRTFTQSVKAQPQLVAPVMAACKTNYGSGWFTGDTATVSWARPSGLPANVTVTYIVTFTPTNGTVKTFTQTGTSITFDDGNIASAGTVTITASAPGYLNSPSSPGAKLTYTPAYFFGYYLRTDVQCG